MSDLAAKHEIISVINSRGWYYITQIAEQLVANMERQAIDEEDDAKGNTLRREAKAARRFLSEFIRTIDNSRQLEEEMQAFVEVATD